MTSPKSLIASTFLTILGLWGCGGLAPSNFVSAKYYGSFSPSDTIQHPFINVDMKTLNSLFCNIKKSEGYLPKGASKYILMNTTKNKQIILQIIAGRPHPIRIVNKDIFKDKWYEFKDSSSIKQWNELLAGWKSQLEAENNMPTEK